MCLKRVTPKTRKLKSNELRVLESLKKLTSPLWTLIVDAGLGLGRSCSNGSFVEKKTIKLVKLRQQKDQS